MKRLERDVTIARPSWASWTALAAIPRASTPAIVRFVDILFIKEAVENSFEEFRKTRFLTRSSVEQLIYYWHLAKLNQATVRL